MVEVGVDGVDGGEVNEVAASFGGVGGFLVGGPVPIAWFGVGWCGEGEGEGGEEGEGERRGAHCSQTSLLFSSKDHSMLWKGQKGLHSDGNDGRSPA